MNIDQAKQQIINHKPNPVVNMDDNQILIKLFDGQKMFLDTRDFAITPHLALDGVWEGYITIPWLCLVGSSSTVMDIGANVGYYGLLAAKTGAKVYMFEANPELASVARKNISVNWWNKNVEVENMALNDRSGPVELNVLKDYIGCSSLASEEKLNSYLSGEMDVEIETTIEIPGITLDDYCAKNDIHSIDLIKLDVEGVEEAVYAGMKNIVKKSPELTMFIEFTLAGYDDPEEFFERLNRDFDFMYSIDGSGELVDISENSYKDVFGSELDGVWKMLVFSKKAINI